MSAPNVPAGPSASSDRGYRSRSSGLSNWKGLTNADDDGCNRAERG
jgi:hypothetical protein